MAVSFTDLAQTCAPAIAIETLAAVVSLESQFQPFDIRVGESSSLHEQPKSKAEAIETATALMAEHQDVQLGLGGIGIAELRKLDLSIADAFDPCLNLKATATLLDGYYRLAVRAGATRQQAERVMLQSYYGRSDPSVGKMAQYDDQVKSEAKRLSKMLSAIAIGQSVGRPTVPEPQTSDPSLNGEERPLPERSANPPSWDVFHAARQSSALVFQNDQPEQSE
ncbi:lytic transglycosylase domain-containing protein [Agrobacterium rhizogenes]|uniref:lytic transglycosylase domain-containing protein n=1 Tax=Rhizobium rhizogenes TaxID=359 RepID=UPI00080F8FE7|nr:lytic transglycosylase domain-containing protein [Rhizobium rhizogenes]NTH78998.1 lytic transglycosylase domain-containing protein [Rhizobium rhizogenes]NTH85003.1 lytic transglycosylase domain-containing protein [Rhizobium rhizogenes]NTI75932.1 lytic transglycosylase domain-containing protein [Rhizobium rhizogenes]OCJ20316.1 type IV secretion system protein VirB1 [Agrobacterium sp. B131/95]